jgi:hypothetical protein
MKGNTPLKIEEPGMGGVAYAVQPSVNDGSELLTFVPRAAWRAPSWRQRRPQRTGGSQRVCCTGQPILTTAGMPSGSTSSTIIVLLGLWV